MLAELIANAYDADANNVYIIANKDDIRVEDDGHGMSYEKGEIGNYLNVAGVFLLLRRLLPDYPSQAQQQRVRTPTP